MVDFLVRTGKHRTEKTSQSCMAQNSWFMRIDGFFQTLYLSQKKQRDGFLNREDVPKNPWDRSYQQLIGCI